MGLSGFGTTAITTNTVSAGDTAWVLMSAAMVLLMTPGLALFYGGMVRSKNVLNMIMMSFLCMGLITIIWIFYGISLTFGTDIGGGSLGGLIFIGLKGTLDAVVGEEGSQIPMLAFSVFPTISPGRVGESLPEWDMLDMAIPRQGA